MTQTAVVAGKQRHLADIGCLVGFAPAAARLLGMVRTGGPSYALGSLGGAVPPGPVCDLAALVVLGVSVARFVTVLLGVAHRIRHRIRPRCAPGRRCGRPAARLAPTLAVALGVTAPLPVAPAAAAGPGPPAVADRPVTAACDPAAVTAPTDPPSGPFERRPDDAGSGDAPRGRPRFGPAGSPVTVRVGDTLWHIAARRLPAPATPAAVAAAWPCWWHVNRGVIGGDPDLIRPGMRLRPPG